MFVQYKCLAICYFSLLFCCCFCSSYFVIFLWLFCAALHTVRMYPCSHDKCIDDFVVISLVLIIFGYKGSEVCIQCNKDDLSKPEAQKKKKVQYAYNFYSKIQRVKELRFVSLISLYLWLAVSSLCK